MKLNKVKTWKMTEEERKKYNSLKSEEKKLAFIKMIKETREPILSSEGAKNEEQ